MEKGRDRYGSYFLGLKIRGKGDEDAPLFVTDLFNNTGNTEVDIGTVTDSVMDTVTVESTGGDRCYGCDAKSYSLFNLGIQLAQAEYYTTALEKELEEKDNLEEKPSPESPEQGQSTENDRLQANGHTDNGHTDNEPAPTVINPVTDEDDEGLKVGDKVIYVGKKNREYYKDEVMEVVKIAVHWTGNQLTCHHSRGWTTWIPEGSLKKVKLGKDHD